MARQAPGERRVTMGCTLSGAGGAGELGTGARWSVMIVSLWVRRVCADGFECASGAATRR